jgi:hypothetical protein
MHKSGMFKEPHSIPLSTLNHKSTGAGSSHQRYPMFETVSLDLAILEAASRSLSSVHGCICHRYHNNPPSHQYALSSHDWVPQTHRIPVPSTCIGHFLPCYNCYPDREVRNHAQEYKKTVLADEVGKPLADTAGRCVENLTFLRYVEYSIAYSHLSLINPSKFQDRDKRRNTNGYPCL